jgi:hypothetical protein
MENKCKYKGYRGIHKAGGGLVTESDKAGSIGRLIRFKEAADAMFVGIREMEDDLRLSENHPYFSVAQMEARAAALEITGKVVDVLKMLAGTMGVKRKGGRKRVHKDNAAKQAAWRAREREKNGAGV